METVAQMAKEELREMIATLIEQRLLELVGDPDEGLPIRKTLRDRLLRQKKAAQRGGGRIYCGCCLDLCEKKTWGVLNRGRRENGYTK